ncbi:uncharacterized protein LOC130896891 isoform X2 [Diorhabda carinulata]|uniref:uncharacterized protein LOC130896891 isoform X2 n=1 Tax=Diorhabda carinulata TaxID=1163345 RepID=UPI0025A0E4A6|nr:uncharacterized protein LOC130896891 isoform X2 [Diorhabda carinulata]
MEKNKRIKLFWFVVMFFNFIFGVTGVIICSFKIKHSDDEEVQIGFFKLSMLFAACNLILSVLLLIAVLKKDQKYAFLYALLIFISLFAATMHIESHTSHNYTYLIIFVVFAFICFIWFTTYAAYQFWLKETVIESSSQCSTPIDEV